MSLYSDYLLEKTEDKILEFDFGFVTFRHLDEKQVTYILDVYIKPDFRREGFMTKLGDEVAEIAKQRKHLKLWGSVVPSNKGSTSSLKALFSYGFRLQSSTNDFILLEKDLV